MFWSETLADRTDQALGELARRYDARLQDRAVQNLEMRRTIDTLKTRASIHRKELKTARGDAYQRRVAAERAETSKVNVIGRIVAEVHPATRAKVAAMLKDGLDPAEIKKRLLPPSTERRPSKPQK
ncbi:hypothetical protein ACFQHO_53240 [Actinomadura yumaensis]|uniref:hypothetical protein n=1 Tax=Actinomadura yumaensis TaxID=111807 RepID=UPI003620047E